MALPDKVTSHGEEDHIKQPKLRHTIYLTTVVKKYISCGVFYIIYNMLTVVIEFHWIERERPTNILFLIPFFKLIYISKAFLEPRLCAYLFCRCIDIIKLSIHMKQFFCWSWVSYKTNDNIYACTTSFNIFDNREEIFQQKKLFVRYRQSDLSRTTDICLAFFHKLHKYYHHPHLVAVINAGTETLSKRS